MNFTPGVTAIYRLSMATRNRSQLAKPYAADWLALITSHKSLNVTFLHIEEKKFLGNTVLGTMPSPASRCWSFTINNPTSEDEDYLRTLPIPQSVTYLIWQVEQANTIHIQGYAQFARKATLKRAKLALNPRAHLEVSRGTAEENKAYCTKPETRLREGMERGIAVGQGERSDIVAFVAAVRGNKTDLELIEEFPRQSLLYLRNIDRIRNAQITPRNWEMQVYVYWGKSGTGKTRRAYEEGGEDIYFISKGDSTHAVWFDGYHGQKFVILDDFYGNLNTLTFKHPC